MELTKEYIENKYSGMFKDCFDFSVGTGWLPLVVSFCEHFPDYNIVQIKEKFGDMRLYLSEGSSAAYDFIGVLETLSSLICEDCGRPAEVKTTGWIRTLCTDCANGRDSTDIYN